VTAIQQSIFKKSSKTYYYSTIFFPRRIRWDVFKLYAFVRTADDFVDMIPQDSLWFFNFKHETFVSLDNALHISNNPIIAWFVEIYNTYKFEKKWVESFFVAMEFDLWLVRISSSEELESYMYGSAAMVWYMMCAIFWVRNAESLYAAKMLAYSMQYINFIRDVEEDNNLWRRYLYPINNISYDDIILFDGCLEEFIDSHIQNYYNYLAEAREWLLNLPLLFCVPVLTASDMYKWTAKQIEYRPWVIFEKKVKPKKLHIILRLIINFLSQSTKRLFSSIF